MPGKRSWELIGNAGGKSTEKENWELSVGNMKIQRLERTAKWVVCNGVVAPLSSFESIPVTTIDEDSISLAESDCQHLLTIFPKEVWELIFNKLDNSIDLENVSNSSLYFRQLLSPRRTQFLFHNVWNFLGKAFENNYFMRNNMYSIAIPYDEGPISNSTDDDDDAELTVGGGNYWYEEILKLRLVCRAWNSAVENFYENHPLHFQLQNFINNCNISVSEFLLANALNNEPQTNISQIHNNTERNPFLGRGIRIYFRRGYNRNFIHKTLRILLEFGHHIWYCSVCIVDFESMRECYSRIWKILQLMPNLKVLRVNYSGSSSYQQVSAVELEKLQTEINLRPLPTLKKLEMLVTTNLPHFLLHQLIRTNGHVSTLDMDSEKTGGCCSGVFEYPLQNLKTLVAAFDSAPRFLKMNGDRVDWPLAKLHLNLQSCDTFLDWKTVFNVLGNKFGNTLTYLVLKLPAAVDKADKDRIYYESQTFRLKLPRLEYLCVTLPNLACLDFLLPMRNSLSSLYITMIITDDDIVRYFESLYVKVEKQMGLINQKTIARTLRKVEAENGSVVRFLRYVKQPFKTNIRSLFPNVNHYVPLTILANEGSHEFLL